MKILSLFLFVSLSALVIQAADPLTEAFQRGLLAEESQRDLKAAVTAYDEVVRLADAQREIVATALFRRAEVRRRQGQTNEAEADYRRLLRHFSDQTNLLEFARVRLPQQAEATPVASAVAPVNSLQLLREELLMEAVARVEQMQLRIAEGKATQADLLQARRDLAAIRTIPVTPPPKAPEASARWVAVGGEVRSPGALKLPSDRSMDLFEAINERGGLTTKGNPNRIQVGRGTNVFRFKLDELMTNRFELQHADKIQVMERVF
jgi:tetratricopeptide (TPR) repeat protein